MKHKYPLFILVPDGTIKASIRLSEPFLSQSYTNPLDIKKELISSLI